MLRNFRSDEFVERLFKDSQESIFIPNGEISAVVGFVPQYPVYYVIRPCEFLPRCFVLQKYLMRILLFLPIAHERPQYQQVVLVEGSIDDFIHSLVPTDGLETEKSSGVTSDWLK